MTDPGSARVEAEDDSAPPRGFYGQGGAGADASGPRATSGLNHALRRILRHLLARAPDPGKRARQCPAVSWLRTYRSDVSRHAGLMSQDMTLQPPCASPARLTDDGRARSSGLVTERISG